MDDDPGVREYLSNAQTVPAKVAALEKQLADEIDPVRKQEIRKEILRLEEIIFDLEWARADSVRAAARRAAMACQWDRAVTLLAQRLLVQPAITERHMKWIQKSYDWKLLHIGSQEQQDRLYGESIKGYSRKYAQNRMLDYQMLMDLATRSGDYATVRYCAMTLLTELQKLPPGLKEGEDNLDRADEVWGETRPRDCAAHRGRKPGRGLSDEQEDFRQSCMDAARRCQPPHAVAPAHRSVPRGRARLASTGLQANADD